MGLSHKRFQKSLSGIALADYDAVLVETVPQLFLTGLTAHFEGRCEMEMKE
jgi:hypothetical protein